METSRTAGHNSPYAILPGCQVPLHPYCISPHIAYALYKGCITVTCKLVPGYSALLELFIASMMLLYARPCTRNA